MVTSRLASTTANPIAKASFKLATDHRRRYRWNVASPADIAKVTINNDAAGYQGRQGQGVSRP